MERADAGDPRSAAQLTLDVHAPAELQQALAHAPQAEALARGLGGVEAAAVVGDAQRERVGGVDEVHPGMLRPAVLGDVRQGFLGDAEERLLDLQRRLALAAYADLGRDLCPPRPLGGV